MNLDIAVTSSTGRKESRAHSSRTLLKGQREKEGPEKESEKEKENPESAMSSKSQNQGNKVYQGRVFKCVKYR